LHDGGASASENSPTGLLEAAEPAPHRLLDGEPGGAVAGGLAPGYA
jgi:hypothetical protein